MKPKNIICTFLFASLFAQCTSSGLVSMPDLELVKEGYWETLQPLNEAQGIGLEKMLKTTPANIPHNTGHDIKTLWTHQQEAARSAFGLQSGLRIEFAEGGN